MSLFDQMYEALINAKDDQGRDAIGGAWNMWVIEGGFGGPDEDSSTAVEQAIKRGLSEALRLYEAAPEAERAKLLAMPKR
ncbi:MAG: hypothetical protein KG075_17500 [Alphaproteobacteria bacterium]|nr:hypothetical protein [Alphaproteobacteria bacterium]